MVIVVVEVVAHMVTARSFSLLCLCFLLCCVAALGSRDAEVVLRLCTWC